MTDTAQRRTGHVNEVAIPERERRFALVVRRALLLIVRFIEDEYGITSK